VEERSVATTAPPASESAARIMADISLRAVGLISNRLAAAVRQNILPLLAIAGGFYLFLQHPKPDLNELIELGLFGGLVVIPVLWRCR